MPGSTERVLYFAQHRPDGVRAACGDLDLPDPIVETVPLTADGGADAITNGCRRSL